MFDFNVFMESMPLLVRAAEMTLFISAIGLALGFMLAIVIATACMSKNPVVYRLGRSYVFVFRGIPLLVQLMLVYYFLPLIGINVDPIVASILAISLCEGAYLGEILRGGFLGIPKGQIEATNLLGFSPLARLFRIEIPQVVKLTVPSLVNETIMLVKASSLISVVGVAEITRTAQNVAASTFMPLEVYLAAGLLYFLINGVLSIAGHFAEQYFGRA